MLFNGYSMASGFLDVVVVVVVVVLLLLFIYWCLQLEFSSLNVPLHLQFLEQISSKYSLNTVLRADFI